MVLEVLQVAQFFCWGAEAALWADEVVAWEGGSAMSHGINLVGKLL